MGALKIKNGARVVAVKASSVPKLYNVGDVFIVDYVVSIDEFGDAFKPRGVKLPRDVGGFKCCNFKRCRIVRPRFVTKQGGCDV